MAMSLRRLSGLSLTIYVVGLVLVCSFILFEVLDVDGSDFPGRTPTSAPVVRLADPPHDLKRAHLQTQADRWPDRPDLDARRTDDPVPLDLSREPVAPFGSAQAHAYRPALARATLADPLPSV